MLLEKKSHANSPSKQERRKAQLTNRYQVDIFGREYTLRTDADEVVAKQLASQVDQKMKELAENAKGVDLEKLAIFTAINIAQELYQVKKSHEEKLSVMNKKTCDIIERIEEQFKAFQPD